MKSALVRALALCFLVAGAGFALGATPRYPASHVWLSTLGKSLEAAYSDGSITLNALFTTGDSSGSPEGRVTCNASQGCQHVERDVQPPITWLFSGTTGQSTGWQALPRQVQDAPSGPSSNMDCDPTLGCQDPGGTIAFDDTYALWANVPGQNHDEDFSSFGLINSVDAADDAITDLTVATLAPALIATPWSGAWASAFATDAPDLLFCRRNSAPFAPCSDNAGTCVSTVSAQHPKPMLLKHTTNGKERYYPVVVTGYGGCNSATNSLTVYGFGLNPIPGDTMQSAFGGTTGAFLHPGDYYNRWQAQMLLEKRKELAWPRSNAMPGGDGEAGCSGWTDAGAGNVSPQATAFDPHDATSTSYLGAGCKFVANGAAALSVRWPTVDISRTDARYWIVQGWVKVSQASGTPTFYLQKMPSNTQVFLGVGNTLELHHLATDDTPQALGTSSVQELAGYVHLAFLIDKQQLSMGTDTGIKVRLDNGSASGTVFIDEWAAYPKPTPGFALTYLFPDGELPLELYGDSRNGGIGGIGGNGLRGGLEYIMSTAAGAPLTRPGLAYSGVSKALSYTFDGRKLAQELALAAGTMPPERRHAPVVLLHFGVNDIAVRSGSPEAYTSAQLQTNLKAAFTRIRRTGARVVWLVEPPVYGDADDATGGDSEGRICYIDAIGNPDLPIIPAETRNCARITEEIHRTFLHTGVFN